MNAADWATVAVAIVSVLGAGLTGIKWMVKHYLSELKPNHGSSMRDHFNIMRDRIDRVEMQVDKIYEHLIGSHNAN